MDSNNLLEKSVEELRVIGIAIGIEDAQDMEKSDLIQRIQALQNAEPNAEADNKEPKAKRQRIKKDPKKKEGKKEEKEQPSSGAPEPDIKGALGKIMAMQGKDVTKPPPPVNVPKPSTPSNVNKTEHFSAF